MRRLRFIVRMLIQALQFLLYKWIVVIYDLIKRIIKICKEYKERKQKLTRRERREAKTKCVPIKSDVYHKPDPTIYSQKYLMAQGLAVTWNNPDIQLKKDGVPVSSNGLLNDTVYQIESRIWNNSTEAPVIDMPVQFSFMGFGIGTTPQLIGTTKVSVGAKGGANHPAYTTINWKTPSVPGHYCIKSELFWGDDANPDNNLGQENTNVVEANSPAFGSFTLKNDRDKKHEFYFKADTYTLPKRIPCSELKPINDPKERLAFFASMHNVSNYAIPEGWKVDVLPERPVLEPNEELKIEVVITPPDDFLGTQIFNINGFDDLNELAGGVTLKVNKT